MRFAAPALLAVLVAVALPSSSVAHGSNTLREIVCISDSRFNHDADCETAKGIGSAAFLAVSPDGKFVYVTGRETDSIAAFARDRRTGRLKQLPGAAACITDVSSAHDPDCAVVDST